MSSSLVLRNALVDRVDAQDHPIGTVRRSDVFRFRANFRVAHLLIFDQAGRLLIQQLAASRERHPQQWGASVAAYVLTGETYEEAIRRRSFQELHLESLDFSVLGKTTMIDEGCSKFISVFTTQYEGQLDPDPSHITSLKYVSLSDIIELKRKQHVFTPTFIHIISSLLAGTLR